ncbi:hypothetical protein AVEN_78970-1, partial [Araneus ventricosus]
LGKMQNSEKLLQGTVVAGRKHGRVVSDGQEIREQAFPPDKDTGSICFFSTWALRDLSSQVRFLNSGNKGDPDHYATDCPVTKSFHFMKPSAENLSTWCENIVQNKRSLAQLMNIMKILHERRHDVIID